MMYQEDWLMRQIGSIIKIVSKFVFKKDTINYEIINEVVNTETDLLYKQLIELLNSLQINEAENLLFKSVKNNDLNYLKIAIDFYNRLNQLSKDQLKEGNFSREEIKSGIEDISKMFGVPIWKDVR